MHGSQPADVHGRSQKSGSRTEPCHGILLLLRCRSGHGIRLSSPDGRIHTDWYLPPTETAKLVGTNLGDMENNLFINIICGNESVDAFDAFCADWAEMGGADILDEMTVLSAQ